MNFNPFQWLISLLAEMSPLRKWGILLTEILILVLLLLPESLFQSFSCETPPESERLSYQSTNLRFIDNQLILIGMPDDATQVLNQVATQLGLEAEEFRLVEDCDLSYLNTRKVPDSNSIVEDREFVMRLYETPDNANVEEIVNGINATQQGQTPTIFADPNYLTRLSVLAGDPCAADRSGGGGTGGGPFGTPGIADTPATIQAAADGFMDQWAFSSDGIHWPSPLGLTGSGVQVAVFDASPLRSPFPVFKRISIALPSPLWFPVWDHAGTTMANSHGAFASALIHRMAPRSSIQLVRVLNDNGCGELWALNRGLEFYKSWMSAWKGDLDKTVINMSLGIRKIDMADPQEVYTLNELIRTASEIGAIFIAAAGNDSAPTLEEPGKLPQEMQFPADSQLVFGVAATDRKGKISCYSNKGDLAAPGGIGGPWPVTDKNGNPVTDVNGDPLVEPCASRAETWNQPIGPNGGAICTDMTRCEYGLVSIGYTKDGPQYMIWSGTSFATPLVSGMAALAYEDLRREDVICLIQGGRLPTTTDPLGTGVIDMRNLTDSGFLSKCP
jgi:hypothetical protein